MSARRPPGSTRGSRMRHAPPRQRQMAFGQTPRIDPLGVRVVHRGCRRQRQALGPGSQASCAAGGGCSRPSSRRRRRAWAKDQMLLMFRHSSGTRELNDSTQPLRQGWPSGDASVLVADRHDFARAAVGGGVELDVDCPDPVRGVRRGGQGGAGAFATRAWHPRPSSRHNSWIFLWFTSQPSPRASQYGCENPDADGRGPTAAATPAARRLRRRHR